MDESDDEARVCVCVVMYNESITTADDSTASGFGGIGVMIKMVV